MFHGDLAGVVTGIRNVRGEAVVLAEGRPQLVPGAVVDRPIDCCVCVLLAIRPTGRTTRSEMAGISQKQAKRGIPGVRIIL